MSQEKNEREIRRIVRLKAGREKRIQRLRELYYNEMVEDNVRGSNFDHFVLNHLDALTKIARRLST